jgi:hypothetical protein
MIVNWDSYIRGHGMQCGPQTMKEIIDEYFTLGKISHTMNIDLYRDTESRIRPTALRYGELNRDFSDYLTELGVWPIPELPHAKKGLLSDGLDPRDFFSRAHLDRVNETFRDEFRAFGHQPI